MATTALIPSDADAWRPILQVSNQVVLYNPTSHALSVSGLSRQYTPHLQQQHHQHQHQHHHHRRCPYCNRTLPPPGALDNNDPADDDEDEDLVDDEDSIVDGRLDHGDRDDPTRQVRAANYFHLLELSNLTEAGSRPASPPPRIPQPQQPIASASSSSSSRANGRTGGFPAEAMAEGYFKAFFQEEYKLGMGANGSVFLCQHVLDGTSLGHFAVKKIAVGESHSYLLKILREVRLLEQMRHPNIITYHHAWLESCQFSAFGPKVPTLHVLMQWAEGGSLDDFIDVRLGRPTKHVHVNPLAPVSSRTRSGLSPFSSVPGTPTSLNPPTLSSPVKTPAEDADDDSAGGSGTPDIYSRSARIRAFRAYQRASPEEKDRMKRVMNQSTGLNGGGPSWKAVHLLSAEEVNSLFSDVVEGLAFLHEKSILHLDLKPGNVLLTWDEGKLIPRAMLSDFGTSRDMMNTSRVRSGNTGTLEYSSPESLPSLETGLLRQIDSKADMWSLGMILHKMLFFRLPYRYATDGNTQGHPLSTQEEGEKLERLEKEVLSYPGFKTAPSMVTAFQARRIPRSFLILLESLLNVTPLNRLSVERIATALKEGRFDPQEPPPRHESGLSLSPVIVSAPRPSSPPITASEPSTTIGGGGPAHSQAATVAAAQRFAMEMTRERVKLLGPPEGVCVEPHRDAARWRRTRLGRTVGRAVGRVERVMVKVFRVRMGRETYVRMVKSCVLSVKVLTLSRACFRKSLNLEEGGLGALSGWNQPWVLVLSAMALVDTMSDEMWLSAILFLAHVVVMKLACGGVY